MIRKFFVLQIVIGVMAWLVPACAQIAKKAKPTSESDRQLFALLTDARLAEPELAADLLLKAAKSKKLKNENLKADLLEEANRFAENVKFGSRLS